MRDFPIDSSGRWTTPTACSSARACRSRPWTSAVWSSRTCRRSAPFQASFGRDAELIVAAREIAAEGTPSVVAGDFNDVPWSRPCRIFQKLSGLLDPRLGRGLYNTFNAHSWISRWPLDHVFFSAEFRLVRIERQQATGSDHYPLLVELSYEPEGTGEQAARAMQSGDKSVAETLVRRADGIG
jgi:hypothetical protein